MTDFKLKHKKIAKRETDDIKFIPYTRHVDDSVIALEDGSLIRMYRVDGRPFETSDVSDLNAWHNKLNVAWRSIGDDRVAMWTHLVRTATDPVLEGTFQSDFARELQVKYAQSLKERVLYHNEFYVTILVRPSQMAGDQLTRLFAKRTTSNGLDDRAMKIMADKCRDFEKLLAQIAPEPLSIYEHNGVLFSRPMEVLHFILTADRIRIPLLDGRLGQALYTSRIIFGREAAEIRLPHKSHYLGMFGVREYVASTRTGQFNDLLSLDFPFVLTQSFAPLVKSVASERFTKKYKQMVSSDDAGVSQAEELLDGVDDLMQNRFAMGEHHLSLSVIDENPKRLLERLSIARSAAADTGMVMAREDVALEAAFWAQLPGNFKMRARPAVVNSRNFAALSPFYTFPAGYKSNNHWGEAITLLKTRAGSSFWFNFHRADVGHTLIIGPTGGGKTVLQNFLQAQLEKTGAKQVFFDKDRGAEIFVRACGGTYLTLRNGVPTGFAPLKGLTATPGNIAFLRQFIRVLVRRANQPLSVAEERVIDEGIDAVMRLPAEARSFSALREMLGYADAEGVGARLERWCLGGPLGWTFDGPQDEVSLAAQFVGFDMTDFLENPEIRTPTMLYLFHRVNELLNGQRVVVDVDEFWKALEDDAFSAFAKDGLKRMITIASVPLALAAVASPAAGQTLPVHDPLTYAQALETAQRTLTIVNQGKQQIQQARQAFNSLSKLTNVNDIAPQLANRQVRNILPNTTIDAETLLRGDFSKLGALGGLASNIQSRYSLSPSGSDADAAYAAALKNSTGSAATTAALGENTLALSQTRMQGLDQLRQRLSVAKDPKDMMDLQARIAVEQAHLQNDMLKMQAIQLAQAGEGNLAASGAEAAAARNAAAFYSANTIRK